MNLHCLQCKHIRMGAIVNAATARPRFVCSVTDERVPFLDAAPAPPDCLREWESDAVIEARANALTTPPLAGAPSAGAPSAGEEESQ